MTDWSLIAQTAIAVGRPPASSQVLHGMVHAAMYDAVVAIEGGFEPYAIAPAVVRPASSAAAVDVKLTEVRPLTFDSASRFRPDGPRPLPDEAHAADVAEAATVGRVDSSVRTAEQTEIVRVWAENTLVQWNRNLRRLAIERGLDLVATARMMALVHVGAADAVIGCFDAKYHFDFWRPVHAITRADTDGNPATEPDPGWAPLLIVNHPEYPSAHACWSKVVTDLLAAFFGTDRVPFTLDSTVTGTTRSYRGFREVFVARSTLGSTTGAPWPTAAC